MWHVQCPSSMVTGKKVPRKLSQEFQCIIKPCSWSGNRYDGSNWMVCCSIVRQDEWICTCQPGTKRNVYKERKKYRIDLPSQSALIEHAKRAAFQAGHCFSQHATSVQPRWMGIDQSPRKMAAKMVLSGTATLKLQERLPKEFQMF